MRLLMLLVTLVFFQETVYAVIGLNGAVLFLARASADFASILIFGLIMTRHALAGRKVPLSGIGYERLFFLFLGYSILISLFTIQSNLFVNFSEIIVLNRFIFLSIAIPFVIDSNRKIQTFLNFIWLLVLVQVGLGILQWLGGPAIIQAFAPQDYTNVLSGVERSFTSNRDLSRNMLIGTLGDFISYGYVLFFGILILISKGQENARTTAILALMMVLIFLAGSRTIFLISLFVTTYFLINRRTVIVRSLVILAMLPIIPISYATLFSNATSVDFQYDSFISIFDPQFIEVLMKQRLGMILIYLPNLLTDPIVFLGLSPDKDYVETVVLPRYPELSIYLQVYFSELLEDVYLNALLSYYGLVGTGLFYWMQYRIFRKALSCMKSENPTLKRVAFLTVYALVAINLLSFGNQSLENRGASFLLWSFVGLFASALRIEMRDRNAKPAEQSAAA